MQTPGATEMPLAELPWQWKSEVIIGFSPRRRWNLRKHTIGAVVKELWDISSPLFGKWLNDSANSTNNTFAVALKIFFHIWSESDLLKHNISHTFVRFYKSKLRGQTLCQVGVVSVSTFLLKRVLRPRWMPMFCRPVQVNVWSRSWRDYNSTNATGFVPMGRS